MSKPILLTGIQPSGRVHIGNYFGSMKQLVDAQTVGKYDIYAMIVDLHALNTVQNADVMRENIRNLAIDYLAVGLDPGKILLFKQSDVPAHTALTWIFDTLVTVPYLERAHAFKDAQAKNKEISVGTFNYPVLMAADILLYDTAVVPVGQDQKQHIEYARDIAQKFNNTYGELFALPEPLIFEHVAVVPGLDGRKMSKSYNNTIPLFASRADISKAVMAIVTDSGSGIPTNVYAIHKLFRSETELKNLYDTNQGKYKVLKDALIEDIDTFMAPLRERRAALEQDPDSIRQVLERGNARANEIANAKLHQVKKAIGVL